MSLTVMPTHKPELSTSRHDCLDENITNTSRILYLYDHMKIRIATIACLILISQLVHCQVFLNDYREYCIIRLDSLRDTSRDQNLKTSAKWIKQYKDNLEAQIIEFDSVFSDYKKKINFDFNTADSLIIIYQTSIESDLSDYIIYSGKDTISFSEFYFGKKPPRFQKRIMCRPFLYKTERIGYIETDDRDSLLILANNRDFSKAIKLAKENPVLDGASSTIIFARKTTGKYAIERCFLQPFGFLPIWRKK
jgi:hypothetical protein